eukprot:403352697
MGVCCSREEGELSNMKQRNTRLERPPHDGYDDNDQPVVKKNQKQAVNANMQMQSDDIDVDATLRYLKEQDEEEWKNVEVPSEIKIKLHHHELIKMSDINDDTWQCNGTQLFERGCHGGITDYYQTKGVEGWRCPDEICDFDICKTCIQYTIHQDKQ